MKRILICCLVMFFVVGSGGLASVQAKDITIFDNMSHSNFVPIPIENTPTNISADYKTTPVNEDGTVTFGAIADQSWDMEKFLYDATTHKLTLVGGWNWVSGNGGFKTGDLFLASGLAKNFGHFRDMGYTGTGTFQPTSLNSVWNYSYVVQFKRDGSGNLLNQYQIIAVDSTATFNNIIPSAAPQEAQRYSNPFRLITDNTIFGGSFTQTSYTDVQGVHNVVELDLSGISTFLDKGFTSHITMTCGNDSLEGSNVPIPGALLLLGAGLTRLAAYARRRD